MTGAFVRIERDHKWLNLEVEFLTDSERREFFANYTADMLIGWLNLTCNTIAAIADISEDAFVP